jgi:leucyl-tRNA synthetase
MAKFMVLYSSTMKASELMANATPEQMKASMDEWIKWRDEASKTFKVDFGLPLQAVNRVSADGATQSDNQASGYSIVEGDSKDALVKLLKTHPHLQRPGAYIDLLEMLPMPGIKA